jgi:Leucine-rich repeat (LRR) protein
MGLNSSLTLKPRRRWLQFSLRTVLTLTSLAAIGLGWVAYERQKGQKEREAVEAIQGLGGYVIEGEIQEFPPALVRRFLRNDTCFRLVDFYDTRISDDDLRHFRAMRKVYGLKLMKTKITDAGLEHLAGLTELEYLDLQHTLVSHLGLKRLADLKALRTLDLSHTSVAKLEPLAELTQLEFLGLESTPVTDDELPQLVGLARLEKLTLRGTLVTDACVSRLQAALPNLEIVR